MMAGPAGTPVTSQSPPYYGVVLVWMQTMISLTADVVIKQSLTELH